MRRIWRRWKSGVNFSFPSYRNYIFFWGEDFRVHLILMILLTNFFYLVMYVTFPFFGVVPLVSVLLASASGWLFWEYLAGLMLYSLDACSLWSPDTSVCTVWKVSKYGVFSSRITGKCGPEKRTNLETFHAVLSMTSALLKFSGDPVNKHHQNIWGMISRSYNSISWYVMLNLNKNYVFLL